MNRTVLLLSLASLTACSAEADIGIDSRPIQCSPDNLGAAEVEGSVTDPLTGTTFTFGPATATVNHVNEDIPDSVAIQDDQLVLNFRLVCGSRVGDYTVRPDNAQQLDCPLDVAVGLTGQVEYLPASGGTLIVDDMSNTQEADCLAARFHVDFGDHGELSGWWSDRR